MSRIKNLYDNLIRMAGDYRWHSLFRIQFYRQIWMRLFIHRNLFDSKEEIAEYQRKRQNQRKRMKYGTTTSLTNKYARRLIQRDGPFCNGTLQDGEPCRKKLFIGHREISVDHKVPVAAGGKTDLENLWLMCRPCNERKGNHHYVHVNPPPPKNLAIKDAMIEAGILTQDGKVCQSALPSPLSATAVLNSFSPKATRQHQSSQTPSDHADRTG